MPSIYLAFLLTQTIFMVLLSLSGVTYLIEWKVCEKSVLGLKISISI